jgi:hypothetical protein
MLEQDVTKTFKLLAVILLDTSMPSQLEVNEHETAKPGRNGSDELMVNPRDHILPDRGSVEFDCL